jgi:hypothetical protein
VWKLAHRDKKAVSLQQAPEEIKAATSAGETALSTLVVGGSVVAHYTFVYQMLTAVRYRFR